MRRDSIKRLQKRLPKLERLLLDTDVNARLKQYLVAVGFDVEFAVRVGVNIHDDTAILRWARRHRRIVVCHDRFKDGQTRIKLFNEVYENGGKIIRIGGRPEQHELTSLGKILLHRKDWLDFFKENDGMVLVHGTGWKPMPREYLHRQIQGEFTLPKIPLKRPQSAKQRSRRGKEPIPEEQQRLHLP